jgi:hypothetical protein
MSLLSADISFSQIKFFESVIQCIDDDMSFYVPVKVSDKKRESTLVISWDKFAFEMRKQDTTIHGRVFRSRLKENFRKKYLFLLDSISFNRLTSEYEFRPTECDQKTSLKYIVENYFDEYGFIKNSIGQSLRNCIINRLFTSEIFLFQDDFTGFYRLQKNAKEKIK